MGMWDRMVTGGEVVTPGAVLRADIAIAGGRIAAVGEPGSLGAAAATTDARGLVVLPGAIDPHLHFQVHSHHVESFREAATGAAYGGVTTVVGHLLPSASEARGPWQIFEEFRGSEVPVDFAFHSWLPERPEVYADIPRLAGAGVKSFKLFLAYKSIGRMASDEHLLRSMEAVAAAGGILLVHAEDGQLLDHRIALQRRRGRVAAEDFLWTHPAEAEWISITKAILYARATGCPLYVVHVSTPQGVDLIAAARGQGQTVWAETCPQYLELTDEDMQRWGPLGKVSPPLRTRADNEGLWQRVAAGAVDAVGSDHSPHSRETKAGGYQDIFDCWYGAPGVETLLPVMWDGCARRGLPPTLVARLTAEGPARIFGLYPRKGAILPGADADLVLLDPHGVQEVTAGTQHSRSGYTLYEGRRLQGRVVGSLLGGEPLLEDGRLHPRTGRYIPR
jgi:D-hydantoinase